MMYLIDVKDLGCCFIRGLTELERRQKLFYKGHPSAKKFYWANGSTRLRNPCSVFRHEPGNMVIGLSGRESVYIADCGRVSEIKIRDV